MTKNVHAKNAVTPTKSGVAAGALSAPDFMSGAMTTGTELLKQYVRPPRIKVVQPAARKPFSELFRQGDLVAMPMAQLFSANEGAVLPAFAFVPLFFWPEWMTWNPIEMKGQLPAVRDRSFDPRSPIAVKSRDETRRSSEVCPESPPDKKYYLKHLEHLNFMLMPLAPHPFAEMPICYSFASGEHKAGSSFSALITMRKATMFGCQFEAYIRERENTKGRWFGIDVDNPRENSGVTPFVMEEERFRAYESLHLEYKKVYEDHALVVDLDEDDGVEAPRDSKEF